MSHAMLIVVTAEWKLDLKEILQVSVQPSGMILTMIGKATFQYQNISQFNLFIAVRSTTECHVLFLDKTVSKGK